MVAPISGVITDQEVTNAGGLQGLAGPNPFTISDLSYVWIICDVYENDLDAVHVGETADIRLPAYPLSLIHIFFEDSDPNGRRDYLWERDVVEAFLQPDPSHERCYREFEISPNGMWVDLDISPSGWADIKSGMTRSVFLDEAAKRWTAEIAIPMMALTPQFEP